jgi:hypothetical protein
MLAAAVFAGPAQAAITVSPGNNANTLFPLSFTDDGNTPDPADDVVVVPCVDDSGFCLNPLPDPTAAASVPGNYPGEAFWWSANSTLAGGFAEFALEAAFTTDDATAGNQVAFSRIRLRFDLTKTGHYRVTHPYGVDEFDVDSIGPGNEINFTEDSGCVTPPCNFQTANYGRVNAILRNITGNPAGYLGNAATERPVVGAAVNSVTVERLVTAADPATVPPTPAVWETIGTSNKFSIEGKLDDGVTPAPIPSMALDKTSLSFPSRNVSGTSNAQTVTIRNQGAAPLDVTSATLGGDNSGDFSLQFAPGTVAPGGTMPVKVNMTGTSAGDKSATLTIASNDATGSRTVSISGRITEAPVVLGQPAPIIQVIPGPIAAAGGQGVLGTVARALSVSNLALPQRISITRLRLQGLRLSMRLEAGTQVVRVAIYKARNGRKTGSALLITNRVPKADGLYRVVLRDRSLLRKLKAGQYVAEVRAGQSRAALGATSRIAFRVTR